MSASEWIILATVVVLFSASIVLAIAETAFVRMSLPRAKSLHEERPTRRTARLVWLLEQDHPEQTLNIVLLLVLVAQLTSAFLLGILVDRFFGVWGAAAGIAIQIVAFFVLAEAAPKTWVIQHTDAAALRVSPLLYFLTRFPPLRVLARSLIGLANVLLPGKGIKEGPFVTEAEIKSMADLAADEESIESGERELIHSIFEFGDTVVHEVMTPRTDMIALQVGTGVRDAITAAIDAGYSRMPVFDETRDNILGLVIMKDLVAHSAQHEDAGTVRDHLRDARFVPEQKPIAELLKEMQAEKFHLAVVVDEYGGTAGVVTLEDLLEEIVGEIVDEFDVEEPEMERLVDGRLRAPGRTPIDELSEELGIDLPDTWETIGGLLFNTLGHVPEEGETVELGPVELCAERVQGRRIVSVLCVAREIEPDELDSTSLSLDE